MGSIFNFSNPSSLVPANPTDNIVQLPNQDNSGVGNFGQLTTSTILQTNPILLVNQTTPNQNFQLTQIGSNVRHKVTVINTGNTSFLLNGEKFQITDWKEFEYSVQQDNWYPSKISNTISDGNFAYAVAEESLNGGRVRFGGAFIRDSAFIFNVFADQTMSDFNAEQYSSYLIQQTTPNINLSLLDGGYVGESKVFFNTGTTSITISNSILIPKKHLELIWNGAAWVNSLALESGVQIVSAQTFTTNTYVLSSGGVYPLTSAGKWRLRYDLVTDGTGANTNNHFAIGTTAGTDIVSGSQKIRGGGVTTALNLTAEVEVIISAPTNYTLQGRNGGTGNCRIINDSNIGVSTISWLKIY
jgi:hypothetical protein